MDTVTYIFGARDFSEIIVNPYIFVLFWYLPDFILCEKKYWHYLLLPKGKSLYLRWSVIRKKGVHDLFKKSLKIPKGGNHNSYIEEEQATQWPKEKVQTDKQRKLLFHWQMFHLRSSRLEVLFFVSVETSICIC